MYAALFQSWLLTVLFVVATTVGCSSSSHQIATVNGKTSAKFNNKSVGSVVEVLISSFPPLKGYTAEIPAELESEQISFEISDVTTVDPVIKALGDATGYQVELDSTERKIHFRKE